jgi:hypothetical protein
LTFFFIASSERYYKIKEGNTRGFRIKAEPENESDPAYTLGTGDSFFVD